MSDFRKVPREERDAWLLNPITEAFLEAVRRDLKRVNQSIVEHARSPERQPLERFAILGGYSTTLESVLLLARGEVTSDAA